MIAQYKTLRDKLTGDYQVFYDEAYQYACDRHYPGFYANDILMSLLDLLMTSQIHKQELDTLIKGDHETFIKNYFHDQGRKTTFINSLFRYTIFMWLFIAYLLINQTPMAGGKVIEALLFIVIGDLLLKNNKHILIIDYIIIALVYLLPGMPFSWLISISICSIYVLIISLYQLYYSYTQQSTMSYYYEEAQLNSNTYVEDYIKKQNDDFNKKREKHHLPPLTIEEMKRYKRSRNRKIGILIDIIVGLLILFMAYRIKDFNERWTMLSYYVPIYIIFSSRYLSSIVNPKGQFIHILNIISLVNLSYFMYISHVFYSLTLILTLIILVIETGAFMMIPMFMNLSVYFDQFILLFTVIIIIMGNKMNFYLSAFVIICCLYAFKQRFKRNV